MQILKAAYYIDEFLPVIKKITDYETISDLYDTSVSFELHGLDENKDYTKASPLLKVAWNIINRGVPTRASLKISDFLLKKHWGEKFEGFDFDKPSITAKIDFNKQNTQDFINFDIVSLGDYDIVDIANGGTFNLSVFNTIRNGIYAAQIQKSIILKLLSLEKTSRVTLNISGIEKDFAEVIVDDLNDLFQALNNLCREGESLLPNLNLSKKKNSSIELSFGENKKEGLAIIPFSAENRDDICKIMTDRKIQYQNLGNVIEYEEDGAYKQKFEYLTVEQKYALIYLVRNIFRKTDFFPGQEGIINRALVGNDVIGLLPTGGGKSLTYQICALLHPGVTVVVDPINSLMKDQYDKLIENGINKTAFINSFNTKEEREENIKKLTRGHFHVIFVSPERFQIEKFRNALLASKQNEVFFSYAVIDEAHCVSEWGHDFRQVYLNLANNLRRFCPASITPLTIFGLTATASYDVLADVQRELNLSNDAIVSLPVEAIDRKELHFNLIKIDYEDESIQDLHFSKREKILGAYKYNELQSFLKTIEQKLTLIEYDGNKIEKKAINYHGFKLVNNEYANGGVIFCPTKSDKLPNGVLSLKSVLDDLPDWKITTFFGSGDDDSIREGHIEEEASKSFDNQDLFIKNQSNLMLATKAFGMGIDKPNIRFTLHYTFPNSVESFYQEAGRAGRDRFDSICSILYHPADMSANMDFYANAFKGVKKELEIIYELLDEVRYEDDFFANVLSRKVKEKYPLVGKVSFWNGRYLNVFGKFKTDIRIGKIDLKHTDLRSYDNWRANIGKAESDEILNHIREELQRLCKDGNYIEYLSNKSADGINTLMHYDNAKNHMLCIGFTNDIVQRINDLIVSDNYQEFKPVIVRAAYSFCNSEEEFLNNLEYQFYKFQNNNGTAYPKKLNLSKEAEKEVKRLYYSIRNTGDTLRAIYRMNILGIVDDYVIDYEGLQINVFFKAKTDAEYLENFKKYLRRYIGIESTSEIIEQVNRQPEDTVLKKVLRSLIEFINNEIANKRRLSIEYMKNLCDSYFAEGEEIFRERIIRYFTSKYARNDYLPRDTDNGKKENCEIVKKYIDFLDHPPDGLGKHIDNAKHLRGACDNLRINLQKNASIDLLFAFSLFALELKEDEEIETLKQRKDILDGINLYRIGFTRMLQIDDWNDVLDLLEYFNRKVLNLNEDIKPVLDELGTEIMLNRTNYKLTQLLDKIYNI